MWPYLLVIGIITYLVKLNMPEEKKIKKSKCKVIDIHKYRKQK
jgi:hypothetical protein